MSANYFNPKTGYSLNIREMKLPQFAKDWLNYLIVEPNLAPRTVFDYSISIQTFLRWVKILELKEPIDRFRSIDVSDVKLEAIASLTRTDIYEFLSFCSTDLNNAASSRLCKLSAINSMYLYLKNVHPNSIVEINPTDDITPPKKEKRLPKCLNLDEAQKLLSAVTGEAKSRDYCIILLFLSCGMRLSELVGININDIKGGSLRLYGKGRKERIVPLNSSCMDAIENYLIDRASYHVDEKEQALFVSKRTGKRVSARRVEKIVEDNLARAGLQGLGYSTHKLRHSTASLLYQNNVGLLEIKNLLGHESLTSTEIYTHLISNETTEKAMESLGNSLTDVGQVSVKEEFS